MINKFALQMTLPQYIEFKKEYSNKPDIPDYIKKFIDNTDDLLEKETIRTYYVHLVYKNSRNVSFEDLNNSRFCRLHEVVSSFPLSTKLEIFKLNVDSSSYVFYENLDTEHIDTFASILVIISEKDYKIYYIRIGTTGNVEDVDYSNCKEDE